MELRKRFYLGVLYLLGKWVTFDWQVRTNTHPHKRTLSIPVCRQIGVLPLSAWLHALKLTEGGAPALVALPSPGRVCDFSQID